MFCNKLSKLVHIWVFLLKLLGVLQMLQQSHLHCWSCHIQTTSTILTVVAHVLTARITGCVPSISACTVCVFEKSIIALHITNITLFCTETKEKKGKKYLPLKNQKNRNMCPPFLRQNSLLGTCWAHSLHILCFQIPAIKSITRSAQTSDKIFAEVNG